MNLSVGIYDLFANTIPGALYLLLGSFVAVRLGWVAADDLPPPDTTTGVVAAVLASYLAGHVLGPTLRRLAELIPLWRSPPGQARRAFIARNPTLAGRAFITADPHTLLAGLRQLSPDAASEVDRSRASGIMLRSACPAFGAAAVVALVEATATARPAVAALAVALAAAGALALREGRKFARWAEIHTYECAAWMPEVDARLTGAAESG